MNSDTITNGRTALHRAHVIDHGNDGVIRRHSQVTPEIPWQNPHARANGLSIAPARCKETARDKARLARGSGNPHYERPAPVSEPRAPLAVAIDRLAGKVADKIVRAAGARRSGKLIQRIKARRTLAGGIQRKVTTLAGEDARPGRSWDWARRELTTEARSAIGERVAMRPCLGCALLLRQSWPREEIRAVFGDAQKVMRRMARGAGNVQTDDISLSHVQAWNNCVIIPRAMDEVKAEQEAYDRARFRRVKTLLRALDSWRQGGGRNAQKGYAHARALLTAILSGGKVGKDYASAYHAFREKVEAGLIALGWEPAKAAGYMPKELPRTAGRPAVLTV